MSGIPALDPEDAEMVADELRALGWTVTPPPVPPADDPSWRRRSRAEDYGETPHPPSWLVEREDGDGLDMLGGGRDE